MQDRQSIIMKVHEATANELLKNGFVYGIQNDWPKYMKKYAWGYDYCFLPQVRFEQTHIAFNLTVHRRIDMIETVWQGSSNLLNISIENPYDITTLYVTEKNSYPQIVDQSYYDGRGAFRFEISEESFDDMQQIIQFVFNDKMIINLDRYRDLKAIDRLINSDLDPPQNINEIFSVDGGLMFKRMAVAKYVGNSIYDSICALYLSRFSKISEIASEPGKEYFLNYPKVFNEVYKKLEQVNPLDVTVLSSQSI